MYANGREMWPTQPTWQSWLNVAIIIFYECKIAKYDSDKRALLKLEPCTSECIYLPRE